LKRDDSKRRVNETWAYYFAKRLPPDLKIGPEIQRTKEKKRLDTEDVGQLQFWYNQLKILLKEVPYRLVYNFDECGFQPGDGKAQNMLSVKGRKVYDLPKAEISENITALECIAADGWIMTPLFTFKSKRFMNA
jgi:hypothetical protein